MFSKLLVFLGFVCCCLHAFAFDASKLEAAKQKFERAGGSEVARQEYVGTLAAMLGRETATYIERSKRDQAVGQAIDKLDAELKAHPAPKEADTKTLSRLRVSKWQATRHTSVTVRTTLGGWCRRAALQRGGGALKATNILTMTLPARLSA